MRHIKITYILPILLIGFISSCNNRNDNADTGTTGGIEYLAARTLVSDKWVFISPDLKVVDSPVPEKEATNVINGYFSQSGTLYKMAEEPQVIAAGFDKIGDVSEGLFPASKSGEGFAVYDETGVKQFDIPEYEGHQITHCSPAYHEGLLRVYYETPNPQDKWRPFKHCGYIDKTGNIVIPLKYEDAEDFYEDRAIVTDSNDYEEFYVIIDKTGNEIFRIHKENKTFELIGEDRMVSDNNYEINNTASHKMPHYQNGTIPALDKGTKDNILLDVNGKIAHNFGQDFSGRVADYNGKYAIVESGGFEGYGYGVIDYAGKQVIANRYNSMQFISEDKVLVSLGTHEESYIVDLPNGKESKIGNYIEVMYLGKFGYIGKQPAETSGVSFIKENGSKRLQDDFYRISGCHFSNIMDHSYSEFSNRNDL